MSRLSEADELPSPRPQGEVSAAERPTEGDRPPEGTSPAGRPTSDLPVAIPRPLRKRMTRHEAKLWVALRTLRPAGHHFRRQVPIGRMVVDFACLKSRLVIEVDGGQHGQPDRARADAARAEALAALGFRIRRYWTIQIDRDLRSVMDDVVAHLGPPVPTRPPAATTLPSGDGEGAPLGLRPASERVMDRSPHRDEPPSPSPQGEVSAAQRLTEGERAAAARLCPPVPTRPPAAATLPSGEGEPAPS